ncbi:hypothetical protein V1525DRAFT_390526 [Lipomyces kononenkoae]|uniref:Uncharacterized protein n=1 Tax=Lipomyces kononenkoae TaxID=34357 RepID=A0ACC3SUQ0_LIPKO
MAIRFGGGFVRKFKITGSAGRLNASDDQLYTSLVSIVSSKFSSLGSFPPKSNISLSRTIFVTIASVTQPPPPSDPPTQQDVDSATRGLGDITLADVVREFRQNFRDLNVKIDRMDQRIPTMDQRITGRIDRLEEQMIRQVEATSVLVQNSVAGKDSTVLMSRQQAIEINYGVIPSSARYRALKSAADIDQLTTREARMFATGYGFGDLRGAENIKNRLKLELGFVELIA